MLADRADPADDMLVGSLLRTFAEPFPEAFGKGFWMPFASASGRISVPLPREIRRVPQG